VGILAAVAIPAFRKSAESSKATEAYNNLNAIRKAEWTFYTKHEYITYNINDLNIENPNSMSNRSFEYLLYQATPFSIKATRRTGPYPGNYIIMDANGNIDESGWIQ
jgi:Tfp pilus assembly protein PilE